MKKAYGVPASSKETLFFRPPVIYTQSEIDKVNSILRENPSLTMNQAIDSVAAEPETDRSLE